MELPKAIWIPARRAWRDVPIFLARAAAGALALLTLSAVEAQTTHPVRVQDDEFLPRTITIEPGDIVVWTNHGSDHTVIADDQSFTSTSAGSTSIPEGSSFSHTFTAVGLYPYYCQLHGGPGGQDMAGLVRVVESGSNRPPDQPHNTSPAMGATNQSVAPTLAATAFADPDEGDLHVVSQWILRNATSGEVVLDTGGTAEHKASMPVEGLEFGTAYRWKVRYRDDRGAWSEYSAETEFTTVADRAGAQPGILATYGKYNLSADRKIPLLTQTDAIVHFDWGFGRPAPALPANKFSVTWEGLLVPEFSEEYLLRVIADGGVRLWINGELIIDDWVVTPFTVFRRGTVALEAGVPALLRLEYFDQNGAASVSLRWSSRSRPPQVIPATRLFLPQP